MDRSPIMVEDVTIPQSLKEERSLQRSSTYIEEFNDNINQQAVTDTYRNLHSTSTEYICHTYGDKPYLYWHRKWKNRYISSDDVPVQ